MTALQSRLALTLLHFLWQGALIAAIYGVLRKWAARTPNRRYILACSALAAVVLTAAATWLVLGGPSPEAAAETFAAPMSAVQPGSSRLPPTPQPNSYPAFSNRSLSWVVAFWLIGVTILSLRLLVRWIYAQRLRHKMAASAPAEWQQALDRLKVRLSVSMPVRLLVSRLVDAPAALGWLRPIVLVPAGALTGLPPAQIEALLLHELAHIRRWDYPLHILQNAIEAVFFYHPAVWWISGHIDEERELCCDDIAVSITGDAALYARALAQFGLGRWFQPAVMTSTGGPLAHRIARLLGRQPVSSAGPGNSASVAALIVVAICGWRAFAQSTASPRFEVASIKPSESRTVQQVLPLPGRLTADASLRVLVQQAYGVQAFQVIGGPEAVMSAHYLVDAKADGKATRNQIFLMLRSMLEDRFKLKVHRDTRELPVYALVAAKSGLKLPSPKEGACVTAPADAAAAWVGGRMAAPGEMEPRKGLCGSASVSLGNSAARMQGQNIAMPELARILSLVLDRTVIDRTGLTQHFDLQLVFVPDDMTPAMPPPPPGPEGSGQSILPALRSQLGLQLESTKGPVEVVIVDHVEAPSGN